MSVVFIALPVALLLAGVAVVACVWAIRSGQYEDLETPAVRVLFEDRPLSGEESGGRGSR